MEVAEAQTIREVLEARLLRTIAAEVASFQQRTGLHVDCVDVGLIEHRAFGAPPTSIVTDVKLRISL